MTNYTYVRTSSKDTTEAPYVPLGAGGEQEYHECCRIRPCYSHYALNECWAVDQVIMAVEELDVTALRLFSLFFKLAFLYFCKELQKGLSHASTQTIMTPHTTPPTIL